MGSCGVMIYVDCEIVVNQWDYVYKNVRKIIDNKNNVNEENI